MPKSDNGDVSQLKLCVDCRKSYHLIVIIIDAFFEARCHFIDFLSRVTLRSRSPGCNGCKVDQAKRKCHTKIKKLSDDAIKIDVTIDDCDGALFCV
jgi:hypothetical protein